MKKCYFSKYEPIFGSWHITEELGAGAEGHLYRIMRRDSLGHEFYSALKAIQIPANGEADLESVMAGGLSREEAEHYFSNMMENSVQEFELLAKLRGNSNIVSYEDHEIIKKEDGFGWDVLIRMEELTPLLSYSAYNPITEEEVIKLGTDICRGLELCSKYGIVHRDIKPENIFISPSGSYKLGDFGIARMIDDKATALSRKGTYSFMAPEIYWGKEYGHQVDIYSLGLVMYKYMNDGRMPFMPVWPDPVEYRDAETAFARRMSGAEIPEPRNGSKAFKQIICKACSYDPEKRYQSAADMLRDLTNLSSGSTPAAKTTKKAPVIAAVIAAICLAAAGIAWAMIPKEVEDIDVYGFEDGTEICMDEEVSPEYVVKPDWFKDEPVTFASSDTNVFTVDEQGAIHALKPGNAVMTVTAKDYSEELNVVVVPKITSIEGVDKKISMTTGDEMQLAPKLLPEKYSDEPVKYKSSDKAIAKVSKGGKVTAVSAGSASVTITSGGTSVKTDITVTDPEPEPVVYYTSSSSGSSKSKSGKKSSKGASKGYFNSSDDEHF